MMRCLPFVPEFASELLGTPSFDVAVIISEANIICKQFALRTAANIIRVLLEDSVNLCRQKQRR